MAPIVQQEFLGIWSGLSGRHPHAGWWAVMADRLVRLFSEASLSELSKQDMSVVHNFLRHALYVTCTRLTGSDAECFADGSYPKAVVSIAALDNAFLETRYWEQIQNSSLVHCVAPLYERLTERKLRWRGWRPPESHLINWAGTHLEGVDGVVSEFGEVAQDQARDLFRRGHKGYQEDMLDIVAACRQGRSAMDEQPWSRSASETLTILAGDVETTRRRLSKKR